MVILYDNNRFDPNLKLAWGFSCLIRGAEKTILFDTGGDGPTLLGNMAKLRVDPAEVDVVVLSHIHGDHTGGLVAFLGKNSRVIVYLPGSFPLGFKRLIMDTGGHLEVVTKGCELFPCIFTTGELGGGLQEQALAVKTTEGLVVVTGCAHPGISNIVQKAIEATGEDEVYLAVGGFHLGSASLSRLQSIAGELRRLSVKKVAPCHCSGDNARELFRNIFDGDFIEAGVGTKIELPPFN